MSGTDSSWLWLALTLIAGIGIGVFIAYRFLPSARGNRRLSEEVDELKASQAKYEQDVQAHFAKTGELFETLTNSYREVYEHLASGAVTLGGGRADRPELDLPDARRLTEAAQGRAPGPVEGEPESTPEVSAEAPHSADAEAKSEVAVETQPDSDEQRATAEPTELAEQTAEQEVPPKREAGYDEATDEGLVSGNEPGDRPRALH
jgi:hypothetical protein